MTIIIEIGQPFVETTVIWISGNFSNTVYYNNLLASLWPFNTTIFQFVAKKN